MKSEQKTVVLFDIDGTLVAGPTESPSAGLKAMNRAAERVTGGVCLGEPSEFAGRTDPQIAKMLLQHSGIENPSKMHVRELLEHYLLFLKAFSELTPYLPLGDARVCVDILNEHKISYGLGTGNLRKGAQIKLNSAQILPFFDLDNGGYGDDGISRSECLSKGLERMGANGDKVVIVGDTPRDIAAAHEIGAYCIAVPHGKNTQEILLESGADYVLSAVGKEMAEIICQL